MIKNNKYYLRYPSVLKKALEERLVSFPGNLEIEFDDLHVYRGMRYVKDKKESIDKSDFLSQAERNLPGTDFTELGAYSCSCFEEIDELICSFKLPRKNKAIAYGKMKYTKGSKLSDSNSTHQHWFLYNNIDPSEDFEVYDYDYEKVDKSI